MRKSTYTCVRVYNTYTCKTRHPSLIAKYQHQHQHREIFQQMDTKDDEKVTKDEMKNCLTNQMGWEPSQAEEVTQLLFIFSN